MSKLVKSSQITIDKKKYVLSTDFFIPKFEKTEEIMSDSTESHEDIKVRLEDELLKMKEDMLENVKMESDERLASAQEEFDSILKDAYDQAEQIRETARKEGFDSGYNGGIEKGYSEANQYIDETLELKRKYFEKYENIKHESEKDMTEIIIETVETILNKHINEDYDFIIGLVEKALLKCAFTSNLALRVSPNDYDSAVSYKKYILSLTENVEHIEIKQDAALIPGSCVVDTSAGSIDSGIHTQFENIKNKFIELLQSE